MIGVQVDEVLESSNAFLSGFRSGDVILEVGNVQVQNPVQMFNELSKHQESRQVEIKFFRNQKELFSILPLN